MSRSPAQLGAAAGAGRLARPARRSRRCRSATASRRPSWRERSRRSGSDDGTATTTRAAAADAPGAPRFDALFVRLGRASESILASLDGGIELAGGTAGHVYLGSRIIRGWAIELVLIDGARSRSSSALSTCSRAAGASSYRSAARWRALRTRFGIWLWIGLLDRRSARSPACFPAARRSPRRPDSAAVSDWPVAGLAALGLLAALGWLRARRVLVPVGSRRPMTTCSRGTPWPSLRSAASPSQRR